MPPNSPVAWPNSLKSKWPVIVLLSELFSLLPETASPVAAAHQPTLHLPDLPLPGREGFPWWEKVTLAAASPFGVQAIAPGVVIAAAPDLILLHNHNLLTHYHWSGPCFVQVGQTITLGQCLGEVPETNTLQLRLGLSLFSPQHNGEHFHPLDPRLWLVEKGLASPQVLTSYPVLWRGELPLSAIPLFLRRAMVAVEDRRFFQHRGIDMWRIVGAVRANIRQRRIVEGASTITQQAVRSALHITRRGIARKLVEIPIALALERFLRKEDILELYFNTIYWGRGATTVGAAAVDFFGKNVWQLNLKECLVLASLPNHPLRWNIAPADIQRLDNKVAICLALLQQQKVIDTTIAQLAQKQTYQLVYAE